MFRDCRSGWDKFVIPKTSCLASTQELLMYWDDKAFTTYHYCQNVKLDFDATSWLVPCLRALASTLTQCRLFFFAFHKLNDPLQMLSGIGKLVITKRKLLVVWVWSAWLLPLQNIQPKDWREEGDMHIRIVTATKATRSVPIKQGWKWCRHREAMLWWDSTALLPALEATMQRRLIYGTSCIEYLEYLVVLHQSWSPQPLQQSAL